MKQRLILATSRRRLIVLRLVKALLVPGGCILVCLAILSYCQFVRKAEVDRALLTAVEEQDAASAERLLRQGADANVTVQSGAEPPFITWLLAVAHFKRRQIPLAMPPLAIAVERTRNITVHGCGEEPKELVSILLRHGASPNSKGKFDYEVILLSSTCGYSHIVGDLLDYGATANAIDAWGYTALHRAVLAHSITTVKLLISHGANVNARNDIGETPLILAAECGSTEIARILIKSGASTTIKDQFRRTAADYDAIYRRTHEPVARDSQGPNTQLR